MARTYIKKTNRGTVSEEVYKKAANEVLAKIYSLRKAANKYEINFMTLKRYIKRQSELNLPPKCKLVGYAKPRQVFSDILETYIYDIPSIVKEALPLAATPKNIISGFNKTGIWPYNGNIFTDEDYLCSAVIDRTFITDQTHQKNNDLATKQPIDNQPEPLLIAPSCSTNYDNIPLVQQSTTIMPQESQELINIPVIVSPENIRPFPKAGERKCNRSRKKMISTILTDTPEKEKLRLEQEAREEKIKNKELKCKKRLNLNKTKEKKKLNSKSRAKKIRTKKPSSEEEEEEDEDYYCIICLGAYSKSSKGDDWIECSTCKKWAHEKCAEVGGSLFYICKNCASDIEEDIEDK